MTLRVFIVSRQNHERPLPFFLEDEDIASFGKMLAQFLVSDLQRKSVEAIALKAETSPRTLQRFLESTKRWLITVTGGIDPDKIKCVDPKAL